LAHLKGGPMNNAEIECMQEMRNACAACFRVIAKHELAEELEKELLDADVKKGFGVRFQDLIEKITIK
jgi:hypothetical protein